LTVVSLVAALISVLFALPYAPRGVTPLLQVDAFSLYFSGLILAGTLLVALLSRDYLDAHARRSEAFYVLLMFAAAGMVAIAMSAHFAAFFLGLETLSVALYGLIGYTTGHRPSLEASIKYLVLAAAASAFLVFGIALVYMDFGTMDFRRLAVLISSRGLPMYSILGFGLMLVGFGFKLAIAPFHMWSPDVYQGAPAPVTALISSASKGAVFALLLRLMTIGHLQDIRTVFLTISVLAIATMFAGNLLALLQTNVKRLLAYSSIAHIGYLLIPLLAVGTSAPSSVAFYLVSYLATVILAFGIVSILSASRSMGDLEELDDYRGLAARQPVVAAVFALALLSLTGIPLTSGFIAKFYIFSSAVRSGLWTLLIVGIVNSGISAFYYLRVLAAMYIHSGAEHAPIESVRPFSAIALMVCAAVILVFGIYPAPLIRLAEEATRHIRF
jgi:NADH-quinone oxidoreductase subunit N